MSITVSSLQQVRQLEEEKAHLQHRAERAEQKQTEDQGDRGWRIVISTDKSSSYKSRSVVWCFTTHVQCVVCVDGYCCVHTLTAGRRGAAPLGGEEGGGGDDHRGAGQGRLGSGECGQVSRAQGSRQVSPSSDHLSLQHSAVHS